MTPERTQTPHRFEATQNAEQPFADGYKTPPACQCGHPTLPSPPKTSGRLRRSRPSVPGETPKRPREDLVYLEENENALVGMTPKRNRSPQLPEATMNSKQLLNDPYKTPPVGLLSERRNILWAPRKKGESVGRPRSPVPVETPRLPSADKSQRMQLLTEFLSPPKKRTQPKKRRNEVSPVRVQINRSSMVLRSSTRPRRSSRIRSKQLLFSERA